MNKRTKFLLCFMIIMVLISMALFFAGCDDGDGDDPPESLLKALFNVFLISTFIFSGTSIFNGRNSGKKHDSFK